MTEKRQPVIPTVFVIISKDSKVLLLRRANTSWLDGYYDLPAGHLQDQEHLKDGVIRELKEEVDLDVSPQDLKLVHLYQNHNNPIAPHYGYLFVAKKWSGEPKIMEPDKCDDLGFFDTSELPEKVTPYAKDAIRNMDGEEVTIKYYPPEYFKNY